MSIQTIFGVFFSHYMCFIPVRCQCFSVTHIYKNCFVLLNSNFRIRLAFFSFTIRVIFSSRNLFQHSKTYCLSNKHTPPWSFWGTGAEPQVQMFSCRDCWFVVWTDGRAGLIPTEPGNKRESCWSGLDRIQTNHTCTHIHAVHEHTCLFHLYNLLLMLFIRDATGKTFHKITLMSP